jgi:hypothetical protein
MESILDVIVVSQVIILLETIIAALIIGFVAYFYFVFVTKEGKKKELAILQKELDEKLAKMSDDEVDIWKDIQERIANAEKILGHPATRAGEYDMNHYDIQQLEDRLATKTRKQREKWSDWQVQIAKEETRQREEKTEATLQAKYGKIHPDLSCPLCCEKGKVRLRSVQHLKGIDGGKVATAVITGGVSLLAGSRLSVSEEITHAICANCNNSWDF